MVYLVRKIHVTSMLRYYQISRKIEKSLIASLFADAYGFSPRLFVGPVAL